mmetsp:Transcript_22793/g.53904  ORF Transcript_22793/g.53904 Transcript_22793/m.53904 type:complete len:209 (+) Transcript_22793:434-1060(+)
MGGYCQAQAGKHSIRWVMIFSAPIAREASVQGFPLNLSSRVGLLGDFKLDEFLHANDQLGNLTEFGSREAHFAVECTADVLFPVQPGEICPERIDINTSQDSTMFVHAHCVHAAAHRALPFVRLLLAQFCLVRSGTVVGADKRVVYGAENAQHRGKQFRRHVVQDTLVNYICRPESFEHPHKARRPWVLWSNRRHDVREPLGGALWKR